MYLSNSEEGLRQKVDFPPQIAASKVLKLDPGDIGNHGNKEERDKNKLNIEEFECGLQLESSDNAKHEWAFTLYDFDGDGRITKEDLASLLKALYDAVGSSIKLPPDGAKTLKLRLSIGQENTANLQKMANSKCPDRSKNVNKTSKNKVREFSKMNNLTRTQVKCTNEKQGHPAILTNQEGSTINQNKDLKVKGQVLHPPALTNHSPATKQNQDLLVKGQMSHLAANQLSAKNQQELANLVHENMERNQIRQLRRHHSDSRKENHHHKRRHRITGTHCPVTTVCAALSATMTAVITEGKLDAAAAGGENCRPEEPQDDRARDSQARRNYYLDLACNDNKQCTFLNNPTVPVAGSGYVRAGGIHYRSRSHDVSSAVNNSPVTENKCDIQSLVKCDNTRLDIDHICHRSSHDNLEHQNSRSKLIDPQELPGQTPPPNSLETRSPGVGASSKLGSFRPTSLPLAVSAFHHRRHRHRQRDHGVAMQQVAQWIEREHARDVNDDHVVIQRHEHHHIHEHHHHHHYHHYYEA